MTSALVRAAGGLVTRAGPDGPEVVVVHRPRYDDWSLPKGKLAPGETPEAAALREVEEETGLRCALAGALPPVRYTDRHGRPKVVHYFRMTVEHDGSFVPTDEVDEVRWLPAPAAARVLSYDADRQLVESAGASRGAAS